MPQPAEVDRLVAELQRLFTQAQASINRQVAAAALEPNTERRRARLRALRRSIDAELAALEADSASWLAGNFPQVYALGAEQGASSIGDAFDWTQIHIDAVQHLAADVFDDVLAATSHVRADVKAWVRQTSRRETAAALLEGRTAEQAGRALAKAGAGEAVELLGGPVGVIQYADGSYHRMADYSEMLLRTKTAQAYNAGTLNVLKGADVGWVEVLDGNTCGWTSHDDPDTANGTVRPIHDAMAHSLSHPRCRRSFIGRPDVRNAQEAKEAKRSTTDAQRADQIQAERDRAQRIERRRHARTSRTPREPRETRQRRQPRQPRAAAKPKKTGATTPSGIALDLAPPTTGTTADLQRWFDEKWGTKADGTSRQIDFTGWGDQYSIAATKTLDDLFKAYPVVRERIDMVGSFAAQGISHSAWGMAQRNKRYLLINESVTQDMGFLERQVETMAKRHWWSTDDTMGTVVHEFGHHVHYRAEAVGRVAEFGGDVDGAYFNDDYLKANIDPILRKELGLKGGVGLSGARTQQAVTEALSKYGATNYRELCAEAWAEYVTKGAQARPLAKAVGEWLQGHL